MAAELTNLSSLVRMYPDALNRVLRGAAGPRRSRRRQPLDAEAAAILGAVRRACATGATVLIIEDVLDDEHPDVRGHILDVIMLAVTGRERTPTELGAPLAHTGFHLRRVWTPAAHWRSSRRSPSPLPPERS